MCRRFAILATLGILSMGDWASGQTRLEILSFYNNGSIDSALVLIDQSLSTDSTQVSLLILKSNAHRELGQTTQQIESLERLAALLPNSNGTHLQLAEIWLDSGMTDRARMELSHAAENGGDETARWLYLCGRLLESQAQPDSAVVLYRKAWRQVEQSQLIRLVR